MQGRKINRAVCLHGRNQRNYATAEHEFLDLVSENKERDRTGAYAVNAIHKNTKIR